MRYPKLRNGPSPRGEADARHLRDTLTGPYESIRTQEGAAHKRGAFLEVEKIEEDEVRYIAWFEPLLWADTPPQHVMVSSPSGLRGERRLRTRAALPRESNTSLSSMIYTASMGGPREAWTVVSDVNFVLTDDGDAYPADVVRIAPAGSSVKVDSIHIDIDGWWFPVHGVYGDGGWTWGFSYLGTDHWNHFAIVSRDGIVSDTAINNDSYYIGRRVMRCFRMGPQSIVGYRLAADHTDLGPLDGYHSAVHALFYTSSDGVTWTDAVEPVMQALTQVDNIVGMNSVTQITGARHVTDAVMGSLMAVPTADGESVVLARSIRSVYENPASAIIAFDPANAPEPPWEGPDTSGVTILRGQPGALVVAQRVLVSGRAIEPWDIAVSGHTVVALLRESEFERFRHTAPEPDPIASYNEDFLTADVLVLYSMDSGVTWGLLSIGLPVARVGRLSVDEDGEFLLPLRIEPGELDVLWGVFKFAAPTDAWRIVGTAIPPNENAIMGAVLFCGSDDTKASPMPGAPWVCDSRIRAPWET